MANHPAICTAWRFPGLRQTRPLITGPGQVLPRLQVHHQPLDAALGPELQATKRPPCCGREDPAHSFPRRVDAQGREQAMTSVCRRAPVCWAENSDIRPGGDTPARGFRPAENMKLDIRVVRLSAKECAYTLGVRMERLESASGGCPHPTSAW